jgi:hypothetical protein
MSEGALEERVQKSLYESEQYYERVHEEKVRRQAARAAQANNPESLLEHRKRMDHEEPETICMNWMYGSKYSSDDDEYKEPLDEPQKEHSQ